MSTSEQPWEFPPNEGLFIGDDDFGISASNAGFMATHRQISAFDQHLQPSLEEGFFTGIGQMPTTHQSWQTLLNGGFPTNQVDYPVLSQSLYPDIGGGQGWCVE